MLQITTATLCLCVVGVGGLGPSRFRGVGGQASELCARLGEKL